jgi:predicted N-acetyltransferase YhbS
MLRPYAGAADLRRMQAALSARFGRGVDHPGDLGWAMRGQSHLEASSMVTLVESRDGTLQGWTWFHPHGSFDAIAVVDDDAVPEVLVQIAFDTAAGMTAHGDALDSLRTLCSDNDPALASALQQAGFTAIERDLEVTRRSLAGLEDPVLSDGFTFSAVDDTLVHERVEAHRAAFAPSVLHIAGFRRVRRTWPYRADLDRVALAPDGRVASSCLAWYDDTNGWGLLEPVGTRPEFQRRGLAAAVCLDALHHLRDAGAHSAQVGCESGSAGCATYHSIGFTTVRRLQTHSRALP